MTEILETLLSMKDEEYKKFHSRLMPTINPDKIIGVRTPKLRLYAKNIVGTPEADAFIKILPHEYYEENNLHAFIIEKIKNYDTAIYETERFLPYIDNWATCDMFIPGIFKKTTDKLITKIKEWIESDSTFTVRYAIGLLMRFYLSDNFTPDLLSLVASVSSEEYYINMMIAWYFATALAYQYEEALEFLTSHRLSAWVHNKTIQKAIESNRISNDTKLYLKTLKMPGK